MLKYKKTQSESSLEKKAIKLAKENGWLTYKFTSSERAVPDRIFIHEVPYEHSTGLTVFVEFKKNGKKLTELQKHQQKRIRDKWVPALYFDNIEDIGRLLTQWIYRCENCSEYIDSNNKVSFKVTNLSYAYYYICKSCEKTN